MPTRIEGKSTFSKKASRDAGMLINVLMSLIMTPLVLRGRGFMIVKANLATLVK
jgi:hypothetical protein